MVYINNTFKSNKSNGFLVQQYFPSTIFAVFTKHFFPAIINIPIQNITFQFVSNFV